MIAMLRGTLLERGLDSVVVDVGGVGYQVSISLQTLQALPQVGGAVTLRTYLQVREDALALFGFATDDEKRAFELCISVSGIGPKLAMATLSGLDAPSLAEAVRSGDVARLTRIPGIGKKTAERLVMELRDKFERSGIAGPARGADRTRPGGTVLGGAAGTVVAALCNLGYRQQEAERAAEQALKEHADAPVEALLRHALLALQRG